MNTLRKAAGKKFDKTGATSQPPPDLKLFHDVAANLRAIYKHRIFPLERHHRFHAFHNPPFEDGEFDSKPTVLLLGQYSTGKSTVIKYLIDSDYPGLRVGPEPTTDKFVVVMHGKDRVVVPGNAVTIDNAMGFHTLSKFGGAFLNRFQVSKVDATLLRCMTLVDTPGILSGSEARLERGYDLVGVLEWFAERVDRILLIFDVHQLDISDELLRCIKALRGFEDKVRMVLNKADGVDGQQLVRVYGALMWSLGRVIPAPESARVFIGSFWDQAFRCDFNRRLLEDEEEDLLRDLQSLPRDAAIRRINDLIKRTKRAKIHGLIVDRLKRETPSVFGKESKKKQLIEGLDKIFEDLQSKHNIAARDFPDVAKMRKRLESQDFDKFNLVQARLMASADEAIQKELPRLLEFVQKNSKDEPIVSKVQAFKNLGKRDKPVEEEEETTPFVSGRAEGADVGRFESVWIPWKQHHVDAFHRLAPVGGKIGGLQGKKEMQKSKLPNSVLGRVWHLSDVDHDGQLDLEEFLLAMHLIQVKLDGFELPKTLPAHLIPPSRRPDPAVVKKQKSQAPSVDLRKEDGGGGRAAEEESSMATSVATTDLEGISCDESEETNDNTDSEAKIEYQRAPAEVTIEAPMTATMEATSTATVTGDASESHEVTLTTLSDQRKNAEFAYSNIQTREDSPLAEPLASEELHLEGSPVDAPIAPSGGIVVAQDFKTHVVVDDGDDADEAQTSFYDAEDKLTALEKEMDELKTELAKCDSETELRVDDVERDVDAEADNRSVDLEVFVAVAAQSKEDFV